ncbi:cytochrome C biogenesis protein [Sphingomonas sp. CGMCC 1.13654]|uniref:Cytochrome C biogenesis protein n=1 Tax=Sphingomonas chungangi TaxID=2683589 RepID=A0A838LGC3_9SPHN|nr:cytochrome C biogenesis protein [Sphingomonas chungangi]MBA2936478.1 cytochrome C biogenesis protein [Sphingomonas chungangi]MVW55863.1 cytochrome C biogenesis protein [Sphingomonas chungangi]
MIGWLIFLLLALVVLGLLTWPMRLARPALMLVGAALFTAAAGYAWQGSPGLTGAPSAAAERPLRPDSLFAAERMRFLNHYGETGIALGTADAFNRMGEDEGAAWLLRNAIVKRPNDADLRVGYAHALFVLAKGHVTPAVTLAFDRADAVAKPGNPAPAYFRGLAYLEGGDLDEAQQVWRSLRAALPAASPWIKPMEERIALVDILRQRATMGAQPAP